jgi:hypothetical protein
MSLEGCWAKVARARDHIGALEEFETAFLKRRPNYVRFDKESEPPWVLLRAVIEPVPLVFSTIAGDVVHNLRSALDHLAWQIVLSEESQPGRHTFFPICAAEADFDSKVRDPPEYRRSPLHGIDPAGEKWALIEGFQPYKTDHPFRTSLYALNSLWNRDKHRWLLPGVTFVHEFDPASLKLKVTQGFETKDLQQTFKGHGALAHDAELFRFIPLTPGAMEVKGDYPFQISVCDGDPVADDTVAVAVNSFDAIRNEVVTIIRAFERFFP